MERERQAESADFTPSPCTQGKGRGEGVAEPPAAMHASRAALLTPPGAGAIAVVRLAGPGVAEFLGRHFRGRAKPGQCAHGRLVDGQRIIDDPVVVLHDEDQTADINLHGGEWVVRECLDLAKADGFELVEQCDDLLDAAGTIEREMLAALPMARTEPAVRALLAQPALWAKLGCVTISAANSPTPGTPGESPLSPSPCTQGEGRGEGKSQIANPKLQIPKTLTLTLSRSTERGNKSAGLGGCRAPAKLPSDRAVIQRMIDDASLWWMLHPPRVVIVGAANVGKSTLANRLFGQERSITADLPGTTRDWVGDWANLDGLAIHLIDTPGQRQSTDPIEQAAVSQSRHQIEQADLVVIVLDPTRPLAPEQSAVLASYPNALRVTNKSDLPAMWDPRPLAAVPTVATTNQGVDGLRQRIRQHFQCDRFAADDPHWWTARQREILRRTVGDVTVMKEM